MNKIALISAFACVLLGLIIILVIYFSSILPSKRNSNLQMESGVIAVVGEEKIYTEDLDNEKKYAPPNSTISNSEDFYINKLVRDSLILQAAQSEQRIALDSSFYNSRDKDYQKRVAMLKNVEASVEQDIDKIEGHIVSIWFFNNDYVGPLGYEGGKNATLEKIREIHNEVANGSLTIEQAGAQVAEDATLAQTDPSYKANALYSFSVQIDKSITFDPSFDSVLKEHEIGETSEIYTLGDTNDNTRSPVPAAHAFGQITKRQGKGIKSFADWITSHESKYVVIYNK